MPPNCGPGDTIKVDTSVNLQFTVEDGMVPGGTSLAHVYVDQYAVRGAEESFSCARTLQKPDSKHSAHAGFDGPSHTVSCSTLTAWEKDEGKRALRLPFHNNEAASLHMELSACTGADFDAWVAALTRVPIASTASGGR
eukprot:198499-Prymnesium_polylepis.3